MIEELHKLLDIHERLLGFPSLKNLKTHIEERIQKLEDSLNKPKPRGDASDGVKASGATDNIERRP